MGVSEPHWRPPYATALDALRELEISYGTAGLEMALRQLNADGFYTRVLAANPDRLRRTIGDAQALGYDAVDSELIAAVESATPFPGVLAAAA